MQRRLAAMAVMCVAGLSLPGCNSVEGPGQDSSSKSVSDTPSVTTRGAGNGPSAQTVSSSADGSQPGRSKEAPVSGRNDIRYAVSAAVRNSAEYRSAELNHKRKGVNVSIEKSGYMPTLQSSVSYGTENDAEYNLSLSQPVFDFGETQSRVAQARYDEVAASQELKDLYEDIALRTAEAYISIKRNEALLAAAIRNLEMHKDIRGLAGERVKAGAADSAEVQLAEVQMSGAEALRDDFESELNLSSSAYASLVGHPPARLSDVMDLDLDLSAYGSGGGAVDGSHSVKRAVAMERRNRSELQAEKSSLFPKVSLEAYYRRGDSGSSEQGMLVRLKGPTLTGLSNFQRVQAMQLSAEGSRMEVEHVRRGLKQELTALSQSNAADVRRVRNLEARLKTTKRLRDVYREKFKVGSKSLTDLTSVQRDYFDIEQSIINARYSILTNEYTAARKLGILKEKLGL